MKRAGAAAARAVAWQAAWAFLWVATPTPSRADLWTAENRIESRLESNDNYLLAPKSNGTVNTLSLSDALKASRQTEAGATRVDAVVSALSGHGPGGESRVDGRLGLTQTLVAPRDEFSLAALYAQDFNDSVQTADVTVGRGRRRTATANGSWSHSLSERLSASLQAAYDHTSYAQGAASSFANAVIGSGASYRLSDTDALSLQANRSDYRSETGNSRATTDSVSIGATRALSERSSASLSVGIYRTRSAIDGFGIACPIAAIYCQDGLVSLVIFALRQESTARGLQYSGSYRYQFDERTDLSLSASRQQAPSGAGSVVRNDTLNASVSRAFSERLNGSISYAQSRSTQEVLGGGQIGQRQLSVGLGRQMSTDVSVAASYQRTESDPAGGHAHANSISVSISIDWPRRLEANH